MKYSALFVSLVIFTIHSHAQKWNQIKQEVGITFGGVFPIDYFEKGGNVTFETIYSKYHQSGIGFRTGFRYFSEVAEYKHALGIPLAIAYRWSFKDLDFFESGMNAARHSAMNNGGLVEMIASFFLSLNQSIVFFAGVTVTGTNFPSYRIHTLFAVRNSIVHHSAHWWNKYRLLQNKQLSVRFITGCRSILELLFWTSARIFITRFLLYTYQHLSSQRSQDNRPLQRDLY